MSSTQTPIVPADLGRFAEVSQVEANSDGSAIVAVVSTPDLQSNRYRSTVVICPVRAGGSPTELSGSAALPRWSPTAPERFAVVRHDASGSTIEVHGPAGSAVATVVSDWPDAIEELSWSPDGAWLLFVVREPQDRAYWATPEDRRPPLRLTGLRYQEDGIGWLVGRPRQAYVVPASGGSPRKISRGGYDDAEFSWHPDGRSVFFVSQRQADRDRTVRNAVFQQQLDSTADPLQLTDTAWCYGAPQASPDGSRVAVTRVDIDGYPAAGHLAVLALADGSVRDLTAELDRECLGSSIRWLDQRRIAVLVEDAGATGIREFDLTDGTARQVLGGPRRVTSFAVVDGAFAGVVQTPDGPPRLVLASADGAETDLLAPNAELAEARWRCAPEHRRVPVADGVEIDTWLLLPPAAPVAAGHPLLVWLQGGGTAYGYQFSHEVQALCAAGFAVLYLNPRGSAGYGTDWMRAVSGPGAAVPGTGWGVDDIADVAAAVTATLAATPGLDPARVGVLGGSYGGLVTTHLLAQTELFAAGWAERGPYNLYSDAGTKDEAPWFFEAYLGGDHLQDPAAYWAASPLRLVEQITAPLIIVHSEEDRRCAVQQAEELFTALKLLGREVEFVRFPGECHGLTRSGSPIHRLQRLEIMLEWFGRWLTPAG
jgi:dipeptidyl aminopeptidase/acylaminoacyl peptidase